MEEFKTGVDNNLPATPGGDISKQENVIKTPERKRINFQKIKILYILWVIFITTFLLAVIYIRYFSKQKVTNNNQQDLVETNTESKSIDSFLENQIMVYVSNSGDIGGVYIKKGLSEPEILIAKDGSSASYSPTLSKIAYIKMDQDNEIYVYDVNTQKTETIKTDEWRLRDISWSPAGNYLLTDSGTSNTGTGAVYVYPGGKKLTTFSTVGRSLDVIKWKWLNDNEFVTTYTYPNPSPEPMENGEGVEGISKYSLPSGISKAIVVPEKSERYSPLQVESNNIYFSETNYIFDKEGNYSGNSEKHWKINVNGGKKEEIDKTDVPVEKMVKTINENLPQDYSNRQVNIIDLSVNSKDSNWVFFAMYYYDQENTRQYQEVAVMNLQDPKGTFSKVADGRNPSW